MNLFYQPELSTEATYFLNEEESRHCTQVLRLKKGHIIHITNGHGVFFTAEILEPGQKKCLIRIISEKTTEKDKNFSLHVAIAPTKNMDRMEWLIEKAVELGIDEITPLICSRSERKIIKTDRLEKIAVAALKQSLKFFLPQINQAVPIHEFIAQASEKNRFICFGEAPPENNLHRFTTVSKNNLFLIGPEGDFSSEEIQLAVKNNFIPLHLGNARLRSETAALHVISIVNFVLNKV